MLRPYQIEALKAIVSHHEKGVNRQVVACATGTGKTVLFAQLPEHIPGQMLVLAHREELIDQAINKIKSANPSLDVSKEMADHYADPDSDVIVASVATLGRKDSERSKRFNWDNIKTVVTDECHHATSQSYKNIYEMAGVLSPDTKKLHVGFTATPRRADHQGLSEIYDQIVFNYTIRQGIDENYLVEIRGIKVDTKTSLDAIATKAGDLDQSELAVTVNTPYRNQLIVQAWKDNAENKQTIAFAVDIQHSKDLAQAFVDNGIKAEALWGNDPERESKIARHRSSKTTVLVNCAVLIEGYDDPAVSCIILARPTKSSVFFTQCVGRATRLYLGKYSCLIIDVCDSTSRHSLISVPSLLGLPAGLDLKGKGLVWAAKELEKVQQEFTHLDFTSLKDITKIKAFVESVDLFAIKPPPEIEASSKFTWHPAMGGGYILMLPEKGEQIKIEQNLLDKWELKGYLRGKKYKGERATMEEAFAAADNLIKQAAPESLKIVDKSAGWRQNPASKKQITALKRLYKGKQIPDGLTSGEASEKIAAAKAKKN
jgi:ATP-dependent helicase IRC3